MFSKILQPQLFFVASQSLAGAYEKEGERKRVLDEIVGHKPLAIVVAGASQIYTRASGSVSGKPTE
jgi:hypothetical protein